MDEAIQLFSEVLFHPNAGANGFDDAVFKREIGTLKQKINAIQDDKMSYANMRLIDEMCSEEAYQLHVHGYEEDLNTLTNEDLFSYYKQMLEQDKMDIYVLGDFAEEKVKHLIMDTMQRTEQVVRAESATPVRKSVEEQQEIIEKQKVQQAKLHIGYRTNTTYQDDAYFALQVFNGLFGGFPSSKLFINVREKIVWPIMLLQGWKVIKDYYLFLVESPQMILKKQEISFDCKCKQ